MIITEYMENGSLDTFLKVRRKSWKTETPGIETGSGEREENWKLMLIFQNQSKANVSKWRKR